MKAKEYLMRISCLNICIEQKEAELRRIEEERTFISAIRYDKDRVDRVDSSVDGSGFTRLSERIVDIKYEIENDKMRLIELRNEIIKQIQMLDDARYIKLLYKRYVEEKSFEQIALEMKYDYWRVLHLHGEALQSFEFNLEGQFITTS